MQTKEIQEPEGINISLGDVLRFVRKSWLTIALFGILATIVGVAYALLAPIEYTTSVKLLPEFQSKSGLGDFKALADLVGMNMGSGTAGADAVRPDLYPSVLASTPFLMAMLETQVRTKDSPEKITLEKYLLTRKHRLEELTGWKPSEKKSESTFEVPKDYTDALVLDAKRDDLIKEMGKRITAVLDKKSGIIQITVKMPDPLVAATIGKLTGDYLTAYMTEYRTSKTRSQVQLLEGQVGSAKGKFKQANVATRSFKDQVRNPFFSVTSSDETQLITDQSISQSLYTQLSTQLAQARIRLQEETPVIKILEPARVPLLRSEPKRALLVLNFLIGGLGLGILVGLVRINYGKDKN